MENSHPHTIKHLKYLSSINVLIIKLIHFNKLDRVKHFVEYKEYIKKQLRNNTTLK